MLKKPLILTRAGLVLLLAISLTQVGAAIGSIYSDVESRLEDCGYDSCRYDRQFATVFDLPSKTWPIHCTSGSTPTIIIYERYEDRFFLGGSELFCAKTRTGPRDSTENCISLEIKMMRVVYTHQGPDTGLIPEEIMDKTMYNVDTISGIDGTVYVSLPGGDDSYREMVCIKTKGTIPKEALENI